MYINNRGKVEDTRLEAKDTKKISRPKTDPLKPMDPDASVLQKNNNKKKVFKILFQAILKDLQKFISGDLKKKVFKNFFQAKKIFKNFFSGDLFLRKPKKRSADFPQSFWRFPTKFQQIKNSAVLEPRTGQFSKT